ncbi:RsmB/NOP family class I SAM-dependent RNA methyltransferase [Chitinimonas sp. BJYL2]|uniref:RsmB/NOP family class I SAM-dependent RNA methyltransferase n=1 Tax=Chitinimonas sp. BJYL2 TaxID=2976696 RepID=UPI0022B5167B|nr:RsmB/NOP family class I SAM-dependent RNA methyltransferase [Chitinimonas sp. BJYL2]
MSSIKPELFAASLTALRAAISFSAPADAVLSRFFRENPNLGSHDRQFVAEAVFGVLRKKRLLDRVCAPDSNPRRLLLAWLARSGRNLREFEAVVTRDDERAFVGSVKGFSLDQLSLAERAELPDWVADELQAAGMPDADIVTLGQSLSQAAPLDLRVNVGKMKRESVQVELAAHGIHAEPTPYSPFGLRAQGKPAVNRLGLFTAGAIEVQDEGSQLLGLLVGPKRGEMVADFCAGAGGKTLLLGMLMASTGRLYAFDVAEKRLANLKPRLARSGLSNVQPQRIESENDSRIKRLAGKLDRVLVDAPCSGMGTLRRNPDLKFRQSAQSVDELNAKQASILASAARMVKVGGRLVYATCSILPRENQGIVDAFLQAHPGFALVPANEVLAEQKIGLDTGPYLQLNPAAHGCDGFFAAVLTRVA